MIANGRISDRSFRRYRWVTFLTRPMLRSITVLGMQSQEDARRAIVLGASPERVVVTGSLKTDAVTDRPGVRELWERLLGLEAGERLWVAGSTHRGEDEVMAEVFARLRKDHRDLVLLLAPRHPERVPEVERALRERGLVSVRRSRLPAARAGASILVLDTVGELAPLYQLAEAVFVGGSLVPTGGHNMLEPALRSKPVLFGPYTSNFRESAELLIEAGGARRVADAAELESALRELLEKPEVARAMGEAGYQAVVSRQGGVRATLELVGAIPGGRGGRAGGWIASGWPVGARAASRWCALAVIPRAGSAAPGTATRRAHSRRGSVSSPSAIGPPCSCGAGSTTGASSPRDGCRVRWSRWAT